MRLFNDAALPLLRGAQVEVVAFGVSLDNDHGAYLMRAFDSLQARDRDEEAFYSSAAWRSGPREAILACIEAYLDAVIELEAMGVDALRGSGGAGVSL